MMADAEIVDIQFSLSVIKYLVFYRPIVYDILWATRGILPKERI